ncbi:ion transporter [Massilia sp. YIM B02443]|uniref:ion transporter n=1 Tax=Massilia sp. YIM B02443 TaxID=3050127 RepID=UPI0025B69B81|nr:ion transporter [Massilia sp. YIM B02443]MDN4036479.1 ion transporter [Massilia sp. YIM B02443]
MIRSTDSKIVPTAPRDLPALLGRPGGGWRARMFDVIFGTDTPAGRRFDIALVCLILLSILVVVLDSVPEIGARYASVMTALEWTFTLLFTVEYVARLVCIQRPGRYATSFYGVIDLVSVLPTYLSLLLPGSQVFLDVRILRLLRVFRIFKLTLYIEEYHKLGQALVASRRKIMVFLSVVLMLVLILGTVMYVIEGPENGFTSIPMAMYWATVTITTVGYGDMTPHTALGKGIASFMMLLGWGILAVPTGIVTAEMTSQKLSRNAPRGQPRQCAACGSGGHDPRAHFCKDCGAALAPAEAVQEGS